MRKCQMCGYLVLGDGEICKHCGALLPRTALALVTSGPPPSAPTARTVPDGAPPRPPSVEREYWSPPAPPAPATRTRTTPRSLLALISIASMALGWVAVDQVFSHDSLPAGTSAFVAGHGVAYSSPDHTFDARFPVAPTIQRNPISVASTSATLNLAQVQTDDYEMVAASMVLPVSVPAGQVDTVLHDILNEGAAAQDAKIVSEQRVTRDGVRGIEVRAKVRDGYDARLTALISGSRVYLLGVHAKHGTGRLYDALVASLIMY